MDVPQFLCCDGIRERFGVKFHFLNLSSSSRLFPSGNLLSCFGFPTQPPQPPPHAANPCCHPYCVQALKTNDIFRTMRLMRANSALGGFEFMEPPGPAYYRDVPRRIPSLTRDQLEQLEVRQGLHGHLSFACFQRVFMDTEQNNRSIPLARSGFRRM